MRFFIRFTRYFGVCLLVLGFGFSVLAQTGNIRGYVYDKKTGEPVLFTNVFLKGTVLGASTDINGFYSIANVPVGDYILVSTFIGYDTTEIPITLTKGILNQNLFISETSIQLEEISISAKRQEARTNVKLSTTQVSQKQIKQLPTVGGEPDLAQYLQVIPGVVTTGDQGGQLYIRGGTPIQNLVLLDGVTIYNPFHSIGLFSVFETDIIKNVEVMTAGFNAQYGGRTSAVIDVATKDGNKKRLGGKISASPFLAKALFEGPLVKQKENGSSTSFILTGKHSYLDKTSPALYSYADSNGIPFSFSDYYGKLSVNTAGGSKVNLFGFHFKDRANFNGVSDYLWSSLGLGGDFVIIPGQSNVIINTNFSYSDYDISLQEADEKPRTSAIRGFNIGMDFTYFLTNGDVKFGFDLNTFKTEFDFFNNLGLKIGQNANTTEMGAFMVFKKVFNKKLVFEPSVRLQYYASLSNFSIEPRLGLKYNASNKLRFKLGGGLYSQNLISTKSDRDVVNLFSGFLSGPDQTLYNINGNEARTKLQYAQHAAVGVEYELAKGLELGVEPYFKNFSQLININRNKLFAQDPDFMIETGYSYGVDFLMNYEFKNWYFWVTYSLGYNKRNDGVQIYPPHFDRRNNVNLVASYILGKKLDWEISGRFNYGTGFPFTLTQGFYEQINFGQTGIGTDYTTANGSLGIIFDENLNSGRLPSYHRLDLSVKKRFALGPNAILEAVASVSNAYNRENIFYIDRIRYQRVNQLPILPSIGVSLSF